MLRNEEQILDIHPGLQNIGFVNDAAQLTLFAHLFSALQIMLEGPMRFFTLPAALASDSIRTLLAMAEMYQAKNKNANRTIKLFLEMAKLAAVGTAIIGSLLGVAAIAAVTPFLFIGAIGTNTIYHAGLAVFHAVKWARSKQPLEADYHQSQLTSNLVFTGIGAAMTTAICLLLAFTPAIGIFSTVTSVVTSTAFAAGVLFTGLKAYQFNVGRAVKTAVEKDRETTTIKEVLKTTSANGMTLDNTEARQAAAKPALANQTEFWSSALLNNPNQKIKTFHKDLIAEAELFSAADRKLFIIDIIIEKKLALDNQNKNFDLFFHKKQSKKILALDYLLKLMHGEAVLIPKSDGTQVTITTLQELLGYFDQQKMSNAIFHSFFREIGEVQKIFALANVHLASVAPAVVPEPGSDLTTASRGRRMFMNGFDAIDSRTRTSSAQEQITSSYVPM